MLPDIVWDAASSVDGWLTREEANLLWRYAAPPWCEIGTYKGRSACVLSARGRGFSIDLGEEWYTPRLKTNVEFIVGDFRDVADQVPDCLRFLYLDADHSYEGTLDAFELYAPKVQAGGHIAIHDAFELHRGEMDWPGVNAALVTLVRDAWHLVAASHRVAVFRK